MAFADLHLHLLPGLDDGPANLLESLEHAHRLIAHGVEEAVVTPHVGHPAFAVSVAEIPRRTHRLARALELAGIPLRLHPGGEIHADGVNRLSRSALETLALGPQRARWVLLEAPFAGIGDGFLASVRRLREMGFAAVIAHPERAPSGHERLAEAMREGALLQVNVCSLLGTHGPQARERAVRMVLDGSAYLLASDGHGGERAHTLRTGRDLAIAAGATQERAAQLCCANPRFLLRHGVPAPVIDRLPTPSRSA
jgi:protein-tyrosine phosphatase